MSKANRECYTCGQGYYFCPTCPSEAKKETFYNMFCCERCSKIFKTLTDETFKKITTAQCKEQLKELNVSVDESFKTGIINHLKKVFDYKEPAIENVEVVEIPEETIPETKTMEETVEKIPVMENIKEEPVTKMEYIPKKNRKKQNSEVD